MRVRARETNVEPTELRETELGTTETICRRTCNSSFAL